MNSLTKVRPWVVAALLLAGAAGQIFAMPPQYNEEVEFVKTAANRGNTEAQFLLGLRYSFGDGVREDPVAAERWLRVAAEQGFVPAMRELGEFYLLQSSDWSPAGQKWLLAASGKGDGESTDLLASLSAKGLLGDQPQLIQDDAKESTHSATDLMAGAFPRGVTAERSAENPPTLLLPEQDRATSLKPAASAATHPVDDLSIKGWLWILGAMVAATLASVWLGRRS